MTKKQDVTGWLDRALSESVLDSAFGAAGFSRQDRALCYQRQLPEMVQEFRIVFDVSPSYEPSAVAHVLPQVVLKSSTLGGLVRQMTGGNPTLVPGDATLVLRHALENVAPKDASPRGSRWFIHDELDAPVVMAQVGEFAVTWAMPFLDRYQDLESLTRGYEASDERLHQPRRFYLYIAAAYLRLRRPEKACEVLERRFGRPAMRKQYARAFEYVQEQQRS